MTAVMQDKPRPDVSRGASRTSWMLVAIVGLVAAALGLGAGYLLFAPSASTNTNANVEAVLEDWWAASEAGDVEAMLGLMPEELKVGAVDVIAFGSNISDMPRPTLERLMATNLERGVDVPSGDPMIVGEYGVFEAAQTATTSTGEEVLYVFKFVQQDGLKLIFVDVL